MHTSGNLTQRVHLQIYDRCQMAMGIVIIVSYMSLLIACQILPEEDWLIRATSYPKCGVCCDCHFHDWCVPGQLLACGKHIVSCRDRDVTTIVTKWCNGKHLAELVLNLFGHSNNYFSPFLSDAWLVCDLVVVIFMLVGLFVQDFPAINVIRLVRVFKMVCAERGSVCAWE